MTEITQAQAEQALGKTIDDAVGGPASRNSNNRFRLKTGAALMIARGPRQEWLVFLTGEEAQKRETLLRLERGERDLAIW